MVGIAEIWKVLTDIKDLGLEKMGLYYSQYRGFVYSNEDPLSCGRLQIMVPELNGDTLYEYWAFPASNYSGKDKGIQLLPQKHDLVWVTFERGNPRRPMWKYGHFGKDEIPEALRDPKLIWFKSPGGITIIIDDENKLVKIYHKDNESDLEPVALGDTTVEKLDSLIDYLLEAKINTSLGPQPFLPETLQGLIELQESLNEIKATNIQIT